MLPVVDVSESQFPLCTVTCRIGERYLEWRSTPGMKQRIVCGCDIEAAFRRWGSNECALLVLRSRMAWRRVSCVRQWVDMLDFSAEALWSDLDLRVWDADVYPGDHTQSAQSVDRREQIQTHKTNVVTTAVVLWSSRLSTIYECGTGNRAHVDKRQRPNFWM